MSPEGDAGRRLPVLLPVVAFGGLVVALAAASFLGRGGSGGRAVRHYLRGLELVEAGRHREGIGEVEAALRLDPRLTPARCALGEALLAVGRPGDAVPELRACLEAAGEGEDPEAKARRLRLLGEAYHALGDASAAEGDAPGVRGPEVVPGGPGEEGGAEDGAMR